ncbi:telomere length regulation protein [Rhinocladiella similis]
MFARPARQTHSILTSLLRPSAPVTASQTYICQPCRRQLHRGVPENGRVPPPTPFVPDVSTFLKLIGRDMSKHESKIGSWDELFTLSSPQLKERGIDPPRTRRYLLRWREKFRKGDYGIGGDLQHVQDGVAELRVVEVPTLKRDPVTGEPLAGPVSTSRSPGMQKLIINVPNGSPTYALLPGQTTADLKKPLGFTLKNGYIIKGKQAHPLKGTYGSGVVLKAVEGLWEHKRGHKVHGGERRRAETLHKMRVEENKKR